jgi:hypothetical protein
MAEVPEVLEMYYLCICHGLDMLCHKMGQQLPLQPLDKHWHQHQHHLLQPAAQLDPVCLPSWLPGVCITGFGLMGELLRDLLRDLLQERDRGGQRDADLHSSSRSRQHAMMDWSSYRCWQLLACFTAWLPQPVHASHTGPHAGPTCTHARLGW